MGKTLLEHIKEEALAIAITDRLGQVRYKAQVLSHSTLKALFLSGHFDGAIDLQCYSQKMDRSLAELCTEMGVLQCHTYHLSSAAYKQLKAAHISVSYTTLTY